MPWRVTVLSAAEEELLALPAAEQVAIGHAIDKLMLLGDRLGAPHSSAIRGTSETLRELRPRSGRSRWRALYRRVGDQFVIAAICPEAAVDPSRFRRAVGVALARLGSLPATIDPDARG